MRLKNKKTKLPTIQMLKTFSPKINKNFKAFSINVSNIKTFHSYQFPNFLNNTTNNSNKEKLNKLYKKIYEEKNNLKHIYVSQIINKNKSEKNLKKVNAGNISVEDNYEISDGSDNNLALINKDKNQQQININIINNNITNYIYDNKQPTKNENLSNNIINDQNKNNIGKNNFNPNSIIASVNRPEISQTSISPLTPLGKENKKKKYLQQVNKSQKI